MIMGVMKRLVGWQQSGWPIFGPLQVLAGLREERDPEAFKERKRAEKEAARERDAIRAEPTFHREPAPTNRSNVATKQGEFF
jgi:hypothetical protein